MLLLHLAITTCLAATVSGGATGWNYERESIHGPGHWVDTYMDCGGVMQSPINIDTELALHDPKLEHFDFSEYHEIGSVQMSLHNMGGHTVEVIFSGSPLEVKGGSLPHQYQLDQFHFHWGLENNRGSEHALDGNHYPMEMHIVHHQSSIDNSSVAMAHPFGLAVIGFFFEIGDHNENFDQLLKYFKDIPNPGDHKVIPTFKVSDLLPGKGIGKKLDFYRYMGSLTTPPCFETVIWSMSAENIVISDQQIQEFRSLFQDNKGSPLGDDFRPLQPLNARTVTTTVKGHPHCPTTDSDNGDHAAISTASAAITLLAMSSLALLQALLLR